VATIDCTEWPPSIAFSGHLRWITHIRGDLTINEISSKYGVHSTQINRWKQQAMAFIKSCFTGKLEKLDQSDQQLMDKLYQQIGQLKCENDFLKKSVWE
jgi:transposase